LARLAQRNAKNAPHEWAPRLKGYSTISMTDLLPGTDWPGREKSCKRMVYMELYFLDVDEMN
jgi:hypothetical protein